MSGILILDLFKKYDARAECRIITDNEFDKFGI